MRLSMPLPKMVPLRPLVVALVAVAVFGSSGCSWFRKKNDLYAMSPESRPLEVPPDLNLPDTSGAMKLGSGEGQSVSRSSLPTAPTTAAPVGPASSASGFTVQGERDAVFAKVGDALAATTGVVIASKAQILGTYDVDYEGSKFLVRVTKVDAGVYVSAVDPRGLPASGEAPTKLIAALKGALGG
ncbi:hypothetical protein [Luteimonas aquatica]|uniref:hypothetical protein n=1 Tax=Luteimonas aquatica TaxID=450364 RepID=UPI001F5AA23F|nr:hypothetical protein [Luteimonas aquatica]